MDVEIDRNRPCIASLCVRTIRSAAFSLRTSNCKLVLELSHQLAANYLTLHLTLSKIPASPISYTQSVRGATHPRATSFKVSYMSLFSSLLFKGK